jgi:CxxC-x17-CxxC domain-containing protein
LLVEPLIKSKAKLMNFEDKKLTCKECSKEFIWSAGEQQFYADKGLQNPPSRCPECRKKRKAKENVQKYTIICKECGKKGEVPFQPRDPNDILCAECWAKSRAKAAAQETTPSV